MIEVSAHARAELAPRGTMRVGVNTGNAATVAVAEDGSLSGPSIELANALGDVLDVPVDFVRYVSAAQVVAAEQEGDAWDVAFLAIDPARAGRLHFSPPYLTIEASYAVPATSMIIVADDVDRVGIRIATSTGAAYDLHLQRALRFAERCPFSNPAASFDAFETGDYDAVAGVHASLQRRFGGNSRVRVIADGFLTIRHAIVVPVGRTIAADFVDRFMTYRAASGL